MALAIAQRFRRRIERAQEDFDYTAKIPQEVQQQQQQETAEDSLFLFILCFVNEKK